MRVFLRVGTAVSCRLLLGVAVAMAAIGFDLKPAAAQQNPVFTPNVSADPDAPMLLQADELIYDNKNNKVRAEGNVEVFYNKHTLLADKVIYDRNENLLLAEGNVRLKEPNGAVIKAERIRLTDDFREGFIRSLQVRTGDQANITADRAIRTDGNTTVFENGSFTPCKTCEKEPGKKPTWRIKAQRVIHKKDEKVIEYENVAFEFLGVPIAYVPYFKHGDPSKKRESGFLVPNAYYSGELGYVASTPYFLALAPNYDVTVTPVMTTKAGQMMKAEWRHRLGNGSYAVDMAGAYDDTPADNVPNDREFRGSIVTKGSFELGSFWNFGWDATIESDNEFRRYYKEDDVSATDRVSQVFLTGQSERNYMAVRSYHFGGLVVDDTDNANSWVHPVLDYNYILNSAIMGGELSFNANAVALSRDDALIEQDSWLKVGKITQRVSADIGWRKEVIDPIGQVYTPFASVRGDLFRYKDTDTAEEESATRGSLAAGMEYRYPFIASIGRSSHIFEPVGQITYRPEQKKLEKKFQDRLPNEDSQSLVYDDTLLFDTNKFSGYDRMESGVRANVGLRYTVGLPNGGNIRAVAGQSYQVAGENPFPEHSGLDTMQSDYVGGLYFEPSQHFGVIAQARFDQDDYELRRTDIHSWMRYGPFSAGATYVKQSTKLGVDEDNVNNLIGEEVLATAGIQLTDFWSLSGLMRYDIEEDEIERHGGGLTYSDGCFLFGVNYARTTPTDGSVTPDTTISLRVELKHLGGVETSQDVTQLLSDK